ncbi:hypothetical protein DV515_00003171 [Chloebia gouldiae]|uniref:Uncharacterized protein n=1 Tax=Chloebia gouldiae TaxID=44316 RepID=A0A3L8SVY5_CHLGU|nr:hypothetical protein DV515_00003171 [Chloebia gouldiae]
MMPTLWFHIQRTAVSLRTIKFTASCQGTGAQHMQGEAESWVCSALRGSTKETAGIISRTDGDGMRSNGPNENPN